MTVTGGFHVLPVVCPAHPPSVVVGVVVVEVVVVKEQTVGVVL